MKTRLKITAALGVCMLIAASTVGYGQDKDAAREIRSTSRRCYHAMATRNVDALQGVLEKAFIVVKAGRENAKAPVVNSDDPLRSLPRAPCGLDSPPREFPIQVYLVFLNQPCTPNLRPVFRWTHRGMAWKSPARKQHDLAPAIALTP
jgi:hypothetical protein